MTDIETLTAERDEAREWVRKLQKTTQTLTCVYCGQEYPPGSPTHGSEVLTEHIRVCEKHPLRKVEAERDLLRKALVGLVGADGDELKQMEAAIRIVPAPDADKAVTINAIHALLSVGGGGAEPVREDAAGRTPEGYNALIRDESPRQ